MRHVEGEAGEWGPDEDRERRHAVCDGEASE